MLDRLVGGVIEGAASAAPPATPSADGLYAIATGATGAWVGQDGMLGAFSASGWRFITPVEGMRLIERASGQEWRRTGTGWETGRVQAHELYVDGVKVVGTRATPIAAPSGGGTIDVEVRAGLNSVLAALRAHGLIAT